MTTREFIAAALAEDIGAGDFSTLSSIDPLARGKAVLKIKEEGILAGSALAEEIFRHLEPDIRINYFKKDGEAIHKGERAFEVFAGVHTLLQAERLVLNCMQRMSGIATLTSQYVDRVKGYPSKILDTRKTTPLFRAMEKQAVVIGGGFNHRKGLYDMVMLKDNHIDFCGGITRAVEKTKSYLATHSRNLRIEVETRDLDDVREALAVGGVHRIMLDNFEPEEIDEALGIIGDACETEASGGITLDNITQYARTGVDFISVGALTHHAVSLDLSLKAELG